MHIAHLTLSSSSRNASRRTCQHSNAAVRPLWSLFSKQFIHYTYTIYTMTHIQFYKFTNTSCCVYCILYIVCAYIYLHLAIQPIVEEKVVGHPDTMRLHRVALTIVVVAYVTCRVGSGEEGGGEEGGGGEGGREEGGREEGGGGGGGRGGEGENINGGKVRKELTRLMNIWHLTHFCS